MVGKFKKVLPLLALPFFSFAAPLEFNYKPALNNLNRFEVRQLKVLLKDLEAVDSFNCTPKGCKVYLKPLLVEYELKNFPLFSEYKLRRYLGLKNFYRYSQERLSGVSQLVAFFLKNSGYLDVSVKTRLFIDKRGYAKLTVLGREGDIYLFGGFNLEGTNCFKSEGEFYRTVGIPLGKPFNYGDLYRAMDKVQTRCGKKYFETFVYYREPFGVKREKLFSLLWKDLKVKPAFAFEVLSLYADFLLTHPFRGVKFLLGKVNTVYPTLVVETKSFPLKIEIEGVDQKEREKLKELIIAYLKNKGLFALVGLQNYLLSYYRDRGFFNARVDLFKNLQTLKVRVKKGDPFKAKVSIVPPLKGFRYEKNFYYNSKKEKKLLKELKEFLIKGGYYFEKVEVSKNINRKREEVVLTFRVLGLKKLKLQRVVEIKVPKRALKRDLLKILDRLKDWQAVYKPSLLKETQRRALALMKAYGCKAPKAVLKLKKLEKGFYRLTFKAVCPSLKHFGKTAYWVEGRINKGELEYLLPSWEGKVFRKRYLDLLRDRLDQSELFESFSVDRVETNSTIIPFVKAVERRPFGVEGWLGYTSDQGFSLQTNLKVYDLLKTGEVFKLGFTLSQKRTLYSFSYFDNYLFSPHLFGGFDISKQYEEHRDYDITFKGFSFTLGYHLNLYTDLSINYLNRWYSLNDSFGNFQKLTLSGYVYYPLYSGIKKSGLFRGLFTFSFPLTGAKFYKTTFDGLYSRLFGEFYTSLKFSGGYIWGEAPIFERFYLGGIKNLKGYSYESVAPYGGGEIFWYGGIEGGYPVKKPIYLFAGGDLGSCVKRGSNPFSDIKKDLYLGAGGLTAVGPIRFIVAAPLEGKLSFKNLKYLFLVGFSF